MAIETITAKQIRETKPIYYLVCTCPNCGKEIKRRNQGYSSITATCKCKQIVRMLKPE